MSTLVEIEKAVAALTDSEKRELLRHLSAELSHRRSPAWPVPPPDVPSDELDRIESDIEAAFPTGRS